VLGYGVVEQLGNTLRAIDHGTVSPGGEAPLSDRLLLLFEGLTTLVAAHKPQAVAVEGVFFAKNAKSALILGHARGVALLVAARAGLPVHEYSPSEVKKAVGAKGNAEKEQVMRLVKGYLGIDEIKKADAADALAIAICHLNRSRFTARLQSAKESKS
jgi:crossover junction endodeoxyribonuclease RuvC